MGGAGSVGHSEVGLSSDQDQSAAAALSSLARVSTPTAGLLHDSTSVHKIYRTPEPVNNPTAVDHENETYEWDEGGDEKELGTDAMGVASTRDYKPGFFGMTF